MNEAVVQAAQALDPDAAINGASCPFCGADVGQRCTDPHQNNKRLDAKQTHQARLEAFVVLTDTHLR